MRTHFDVVTESLRDDIKLIASAFDSLARRDSQTASEGPPER